MPLTARTAILALTLSLILAACSDTPDVDIVLVSRVPHDVSPLQCADDVSWAVSSGLERTGTTTLALELREEGIVCTAMLSDVTFRTTDDQVVVATNFDPIDSGTFELTDAAAECSEPNAEPNSPHSGQLIVRNVAAITLTFSDGAEADLSPSTRDFVDAQCFGETGTWTGTAGDLDGRSGAYRWVEEQVRIVLVLSPG
jgi:hypothetical protein